MNFLSESETELLQQLEQQVRRSFVARGQALAQIRKQQLYRVLSQKNGSIHVV